MNPTLRLIESQIAMAGIRNRLEENKPIPGRHVTEAGVGFGPCLWVSRECGSGGGRVAQLVGERLGWTVFDSRMVDEIAQSAHVHQHLVQSVDERVHSHWEQAWREQLLDDLSDSNYLRHLRQVVTALGHHGNVVLVGRGAQFMLPTVCGLRLRLVAPLEDRAHRLAENEKLSLIEARAKVRRVDDERAAFIRRNFKADVASPANLDLIVNTGEITLAGAVEIVLAAIAQKLGVRPGLA